MTDSKFFSRLIWASLLIIIGAADALPAFGQGRQQPTSQPRQAFTYQDQLSAKQPYKIEYGWTTKQVKDYMASRGYALADERYHTHESYMKTRGQVDTILNFNDDARDGADKIFITTFISKLGVNGISTSYCFAPHRHEHLTTLREKFLKDFESEHGVSKESEYRRPEDYPSKYWEIDKLKIWVSHVSMSKIPAYGGDHARLDVSISHDDFKY